MKKTLVRPRSSPAKSYTLGRSKFAKISAVEGITLTPEMIEQFQTFDKQELPAKTRRRVLARKYAKALA